LTANPVEVILAQSEQGGGVLGVIEGFSPKGIEKEDGIAWRKELLRKLKIVGFLILPMDVEK